MDIDYPRRAEKARTILTNHCEKLFQLLYKNDASTNTCKFRLNLEVTVKEIAEIKDAGAAFVLPRPITNYDLAGKLVGKIKDYKISIVNDGRRHFEVTIDSKVVTELSVDFVERQLGIRVQKKHTGSQTGYPSETIARAIWRHMVDRYNTFDNEIVFSEVA